MTLRYFNKLGFIVALIRLTHCANAEETASQTGLIEVKFSVPDVELQVEASSNVTVYFSQPLNHTVEIYFNYAYDGKSEVSYNQNSPIISPLPNVTSEAGTKEIPLKITAVHAGSLSIGLNSSSDDFADLGSVYMIVKVFNSNILVIVAQIIGWIYFAAWSISFYPQVIENYRRKSVIGLNFDFIALNLTGFISYGVFNVGLRWINVIKAERHALYPREEDPVQLNDVIFALHAILLTLIVTLQCFIYKRGVQKVSVVCRVLLVFAWLFIIVSLFVAVAKVITWLTFFYFFSYVKLGITLIKYIPQAWMNYKRKSTEGWSIGNILLDFTGGSFSLLQMFLLAYNNDDWKYLFGNPTKFGLGLFSVMFDVLFMVQHYGLYRKPHGYSFINEETIVADSE